MLQETKHRGRHAPSSLLLFLPFLSLQEPLKNNSCALGALLIWSRRAQGKKWALFSPKYRPKREKNGHVLEVLSHPICGCFLFFFLFLLFCLLVHFCLFFLHLVLPYLDFFFGFRGFNLKSLLPLYTLFVPVFQCRGCLPSVHMSICYICQEPGKPWHWQHTRRYTTPVSPGAFVTLTFMSMVNLLPSVNKSELSFLLQIVLQTK